MNLEEGQGVEKRGKGQVERHARRALRPASLGEGTLLITSSPAPLGAGRRWCWRLPAATCYVLTASLAFCPAHHLVSQSCPVTHTLLSSSFPAIFKDKNAAAQWGWVPCPSPPASEGKRSLPVSRRALLPTRSLACVRRTVGWWCC